MIQGIDGLNFEDDEYTVKQSISLTGKKYKVENSKGETLLSGKKEFWNPTATFHLFDSNDNKVIEVVAESMFDASGDYTMYDVTGDEKVPVAVFTKHFSLRLREWMISDPDSGEEVVKIHSDLSGAGFLKRRYSFFPYRYEIASPESRASLFGELTPMNPQGTNGEVYGIIDGNFSILFDSYDVSTTLPDDVLPPEVLTTGAIVIDALDEERS